MSEQQLIDHLSGAAKLTKVAVQGHGNFVKCHLGCGMTGELVASSLITEEAGKILVVEINLKIAKALIKGKVYACSELKFDSPLGASDKKEPLLTTRIAETFSSNELLFALLVFPDNYMLWSRRRKQLAENSGDQTDALWVDVTLTTLLLSRYCKCADAWQHRRYAIQSLINSSRNADKELLSQMLTFDRTVLFSAAHSHPMNYNAWNYRRQAIQTVTQLRQPSLSERWSEIEINETLKFLQSHNGDRSAACYVVYVLEYMRKSGAASETVVSLWRKGMFFTQREIRRHCELGHECMWEMRLNLIMVAIGGKLPFPSGWTVADELTFVDAYVTLYQSTRFLLYPTSAASGWWESSGNLSRTSFLACRYGLQLLEAVNCQ